MESNLKENHEFVLRTHSLSFKKNLDKFNETSEFYIIFQRIHKWKDLFISKNKSNNKGEDESDIEENKIELKRSTVLPKQFIKDLFKEKQDNSLLDSIINPDELLTVSLLTDSQFRTTCLDASNKCNKFAKLFLTMEVITKIADLIFIIILQLAVFLGFNRTTFIVSCIILVPIIIMQVIADWGKLLEKYSRLYFEFTDLANSHDHDRVKEYEHLVNHYRSNWLYADMLMEIKKENN